MQEDNERRKVHDKLTTMKHETRTMRMGSNCTKSSAASTGFGLGSATFAKPLPFGTKLEGHLGTKDNRGRRVGAGQRSVGVA